MRISRVLFLGAIALLGAYYPKFGRYAFYDWLGFAALVSTILIYIARNRLPKLNGYIIAGGVLLILGTVLTTLSLRNPVPSAEAGLLLVYVTVLWISLPQFLAPDWRFLRSIYGAVGLAVLLTSSYAIGQAFFGFPYLGGASFWGRATGLTRQPNELGGFCAMAFPFLLCLVGAKTAGWRGASYGWIVAALFSVLGVWLSGSMTGAATLAAGTAVYFVLASQRARIRLVVLVVPVLIIGAFFVSISSNSRTQFLGQRIESFFDSNAGKFTLEQRAVANRSAIDEIESSPLEGKGFLSRVSAVRGDILVHNTFLLAWHDGGLFTFLGILAILIGAAVGLVRSWKQMIITRAVGYRAYISASIASFVGFLVCMQTSPILYQRSSWFPVAIAYLVGAISNRAVRKHNEAMAKVRTAQPISAA